MPDTRIGYQNADEAGEVREVAGERRDLRNRVAHEFILRVILASDEPEHLVAFGEQRLRKVESVLAGYSGDERAGHSVLGRQRCSASAVLAARPLPGPKTPG